MKEKPKRLRRTHLARRAESFREFMLAYLQRCDPATMKRAAHQLADLYEANKGYLDGQFFRVLQRVVESIIQQETGSKRWTVARSRRDMRGRVSTLAGAKRVAPKNKRQQRLAHQLAKTMMGDLEDGAGDE